MAVEEKKKTYFNFVGGLNTEGSALNNPENTADVLENFIVELNGTLRKRPGLSISGALVADGVGLTDVPVVSVHEWSTAVKGSKAEFFVVQVNAILTIVSIDGATVARIGTLSLATYQRPSSSTIGTKRISAVSGKGNFFVSSFEIVPFFIEYDSLTNTISHQQITIQVRDFYGREDGLAIPERPSTLSDNHRYNLYNQGWEEDKIQSFKNQIKVYPSNADIWIYGKNLDANDQRMEFHPQLITQEAFGNSPAPKGHFILNIVDGTVVEADEQTTFVKEIDSVTLLDVLENSIEGSVVRWQRQTRLSGVLVGDILKYPTYEGTVIEVGVASNGENYAIATTKGPLDPTWTFEGVRRDLFQYRPVQGIGVGSSDVFGSETIPSVTAFYAGRVFYSGAKSTFWSNALFYSQLVDKEDKVGQCYQEADPTSEHISDLIATDGGVLFIDSAVDIMTMIQYESSLVIFASNGVWELSGVNDDGFKATSFKIKKTSDFGAVGPSSVVSTGSGFVYWSPSGIYALTREQISGSLQAASISATTVQTFYDSITGAQKERAKGFFDEINKVIYWMYNDDPTSTNPNVSNKVLLLDTRISAFYTLTFPWEYTPEYGGIVDAIKASNNNIVSVTDNQVVVGADTVVVGSDFVVVSETSVSGSTYTGVPAGFLVYRPYGVQLHTLTSPTFYDFGVLPYEATLQTRYDLDGDALRKKQVLYVQPHFKKEIVVPRDFTSGGSAGSICALPTGWHEVAPMPAARGQTYGVTIGDYFYVFGGSTTFGGSGASNSVYRYNRKTNVWDSPTTMPYSARELTASLLPNGFIHVAGGQDASSIFQSLSYWYDPYNNTWTAKNNLPVSWVDGRFGNLTDGRVLIFGGSTGGTVSPRVATTYIYDPLSDTYTASANMLVGVGNHVSATLADGRIISVGGVITGDLVGSIKTQIFDPGTLSWNYGSDQPQQHNDYPGISATPCGQVYVWGGGAAPNGSLNYSGNKKVSAYDPSTDTWSVLTDLPFFAGYGAYGRFYDGQYIWASGHDNTDMTAKTYLSTDPVGD